ncbi:MAG TPA: Gfo/Idh/MocA family oxidoreductase, partial [Armatimonadota bacterium]|nr:Gfo/Idh/MocA family oxidoreductase [Armatimonadota bacterium]
MGANRLTRRRFLHQAAAGMAIPAIVTSKALGQGDVPPASDRVTLAWIGAGDRGGRQLLAWDFLPLPEVQVVAICDPFRSRREAWAANVDEHYGQRGCRAYRDFREMLEREDVDGAVIATHDGWHVPAALACVRAGVDVYVEKPLGVSVEQDLLLRDTARRYGAVFQYGTQQRSMSHCRHGCELVRNGRVGEITAIEVVAPEGGAGGSTEPVPVPDDLDYDLWLGPCPWSPYTADRCINRGSFWVYDNSIGFLGGWGAHPLDILDWALGDEHGIPVEYEGTGMIPIEGLYDTVATWEVHCRYADGLPLRFTSGGGDLTQFIGTEGWIGISRGGLTAEPASLLSSRVGPHEVRLA